MPIPSRGAPVPTEFRHPLYEIVVPKDGEVLDLLILDERFLGVACHWLAQAPPLKSHSVVCEHYQGDCPHCGVLREFWSGFVAAIDLKARVRKILRLGLDSALALYAIAAPLGGLRGVRVLASRKRHQKTTVLLFEAHPDGWDRDVPDAHHIDATVCLALRVKSLPDYRFGASDLAEMEGEVASWEQ